MYGVCESADTLAATNIRHSDMARQERVFTVVFKRSSASRHPDDIDVGTFQQLRSERKRLRVHL
jgi:hypothetical protein